MFAFMDAQLGTLVIVPICGLIVTNVVVYLKSRDERKADLEAARLRRQWYIEDRDRMHAAIAQAGEKADAAYLEANGTNAKILALHEANVMLGGELKTSTDATQVAIRQHDQWVRERAGATEAPTPTV